MRGLWITLVAISFLGILGFLVTKIIPASNSEVTTALSTPTIPLTIIPTASSTSSPNPLKPDLLPAEEERRTAEVRAQQQVNEEREQRRKQLERTLADSLTAPEFLSKETFKELPIEERLLVIREELELLPQGEEAAATRVALLNAAAQLDETEDDVFEIQDLALREFYDSAEWAVGAPPSEGFEHFLPLLSHQVFLKNTTDQEEALAVTLDGMLLHSDPIIRQMLYRQFVKRFPQSEEVFRDELVAEEISFSNSAEVAESQ